MIEVTHENGATVFLLDESYDSLDSKRLDELDSVLLAEADSAETPRMVVDMTKTKYINSSFIETIFRAWKRVQQKGGEMAFCCLNPFCREVLEITRLNKIWSLCDNRDEAVKAVTAPK